MKFKKIITISLLIFATAYFVVNLKNQMNKIENNYEEVIGDPLKARIYTLENGLKVYLTSYDDAPRIQTNIAVRAGSKNDPENATGLAHYLEHMLFKGTDVFGSLDFNKEGPLIEEIEALYEQYRNVAMTDTANRERIYRKIDSISAEAAKYAIANEYDKMALGIGAKGTNAYTSFEKTVYINDIPSNQLENWLKLESERFRYPVFRLFHTELEAVYEEKNRDSDGSKLFESLFDGLFPNHQYGQQTTIGTVEHLKNPSLKEIRAYFNKYYVPNNMAICLSGDFDYDETIRLIQKYWSKFERKEDPIFNVYKESPIKKTVIKEVFGPEAESLFVGFRFEGANSNDSKILTMIDMVLANSTAGLIDLNLNQTQKIISGGSFPYVLKDYSMHTLYGSPKQGQTLEEVRALLLNQIEEIKDGNFEQWLVDAIISDLKLNQIKKFESNSGRANEFVEAFILDISWEDYNKEISDLESITKQDIIDFAKENYNENYVVTYKRNGIDKTSVKVDKPDITPVQLNRVDQSDFLIKLLTEEVEDINPVFLDFDEIIEKTNIGELPLIYKKNTENNRFRLSYIFDIGTDHDNKLKFAVDYLKFLGTSEISPSRKQEEFYRLGCDLSMSSSSDKTRITLSGLANKFDESIMFFENFLANVIADEEALIALKSNKIKERADAKLNKQTILFKALVNYAKYGPTSSYTNVLSAEDISNLTSKDLLKSINDLLLYKHRISYYGPENISDLKIKLENIHFNKSDLNPLPKKKEYKELDLQKPIVYVVDYDMKQAEVIMLSKGSKLNMSEFSKIKFHNEYFGGGMSSIVFQELRESKALAYSVYSTYTIPKDTNSSHYLMSYIGTQVDKLSEAMSGMSELLDEMPKAETNMNNAKEAIIQRIRTERLTKSKVLSEYEKAQEQGVNYDMRTDLYNQVQAFNVDSLNDFHNSHIANRNRVVMVLGAKSDLDLSVLKEYGEIKHLTLEEVFGY
ncbi:MAG: insulinase family protein [Flavobacteriales bacterium]|nr:insulinase family protein [Flavobacteriales bacterium]